MNNKTERNLHVSKINDEDTQITADSTEIPEAEIRERAYEIYVKRGGADGLDENDWFQAEKELRDALKSRRQKAWREPATVIVKWADKIGAKTNGSQSPWEDGPRPTIGHIDFFRSARLSAFIAHNVLYVLLKGQAGEGPEGWPANSPSS